MAGVSRRCHPEGAVMVLTCVTSPKSANGGYLLRLKNTPEI